MKATITSINNRGDQTTERVIISVHDYCDIGDYLLADSTFHRDGNQSNLLRHVYWFPSQQVTKGDKVVLATGIGTKSAVRGLTGGTTYTFYWGLREPVWNDDKDRALLIETGESQTFPTVANLSRRP